jgi:hypothetical protein
MPVIGIYLEAAAIECCDRLFQLCASGFAPLTSQRVHELQLHPVSGF